jgi:hypothetical protein
VTAAALRHCSAILACLFVASCGGGSGTRPDFSSVASALSAIPAWRPLPDLRHMRAVHVGGNWGGNASGFKPPLLSDAQALAVSSVSVQSSVSSFRDSQGVTHTNDVAQVQIANVRIGATTLARAGFWVYRDAATGNTGLQMRPQLDSNLAGVSGFAGDINVSLDASGTSVVVDGMASATGDALALAKAVLAHGSEIVTGASAVVGTGSTIGQPAALSAALARLRTALEGGDAQFFSALKAMNVEWIGISVAMHYDSYSDPTVRTHVCALDFTDSGGNPTPCTFADDYLQSFISRARAAGFRIYLTLAFESSAAIDSLPRATCGTPQFKENRSMLGAPVLPDWAAASHCIDAANWWWNPAHADHATKVQAFFDSYRDVAVKYAGLAESAGVELFSIGTETENLFRTRPSGGAYTNQFLPQLQALVAGVRSVYGGAVTYDQSSELYFRPATYGGSTAGGADLFNDLDLDVVGSSAYFPLAATSPGRVLSVSELENAWESVFQSYLLPMHAKYGNKPIVFTEVGYTDDLDSPWQSAAGEGSAARAHAAGTSTPGMQQQANIYQAFFNVNARHADLVAGTFWWGYEYFPARADLCSYVGFSTYCNPAATGVIADAYQRLRRQDTDRVFSWAASVYPQFFSGAVTGGVFGDYYYRYHAGSGTYLGLQESTGDVYVHDGRAFNFMNVGALRNYLDPAAAAGY